MGWIDNLPLPGLARPDVYRVDCRRVDILFCRVVLVLVQTQKKEEEEEEGGESRKSIKKRGRNKGRSPRVMDSNRSLTIFGNQTGEYLFPPRSSTRSSPFFLYNFSFLFFFLNITSN